jgi:AcrR family transcriptional regulator
VATAAAVVPQHQLNGLYPGYYSGRRVCSVEGPELSWGAPPGERADAARNRLHLLSVARQFIAEQGADTVFRRFGSRAGIFHALLDEEERDFQAQVLSGPPPLGPGAAPLDRLVAYGRARTGFLIEHREIARNALDGSKPVPAGAQTPLSQTHIRMLLSQLDIGGADLDIMAIQLTAALDGPLLLYLSAADLAEPGHKAAERIARGWQDLVQRVCRP